MNSNKQKLSSHKIIINVFVFQKFFLVIKCKFLQFNSLVLQVFLYLNVHCLTFQVLLKHTMKQLPMKIVGLLVQNNQLSPMDLLSNNMFFHRLSKL